MSLKEDIALMAEIKKGNENAVKTVYKLYYEVLCRFAYNFTRNRMLSEEIVDDVIFGFWQRRDFLPSDTKIFSYLLKGVKNKCLNEINSKRRRVEGGSLSYSSEENFEFINKVFADEDNPLENLVGRETLKELGKAIEELPSMSRKVFILSRYHEKTYDQIASHLNISVNTVKYHIKKSLSCLKSFMDKYLTVFFFFL